MRREEFLIIYTTSLLESVIVLDCIYLIKKQKIKNKKNSTIYKTDRDISLRHRREEEKLCYTI